MSDTDATGDDAGVTDQAIDAKVEEAEAAALDLANVDDADRQAALHAIADAIDDNREAIQSANAEDVEAAEELLDAGEYSQALVDRLKLSEAKLDSIVEMVAASPPKRTPSGRPSLPANSTRIWSSTNSPSPSASSAPSSSPAPTRSSRSPPSR